MSHLVNLHASGLVTPRMVALRAAMSLLGAYGVLHHLIARSPER